MSDEDSTKPPMELMKTLGISREQLQNAKLGPGVVGRNSVIAYAFLGVALAGVIAAGSLHSTMLAALCVAAAFVIVIFVASLNAYFGNKNPAVAVLEGAQFLQYQQSQMAAKGFPVIEAGPPKPPPKGSLTGSNKRSATKGDESK